MPKPRSRKARSRPSLALPKARGPLDRRSAARELREVLKVQVETGEELRSAKVPIVTEPAFVFKV